MEIIATTPDTSSIAALKTMDMPSFMSFFGTMAANTEAAYAGDFRRFFTQMYGAYDTNALAAFLGSDSGTAFKVVADYYTLNADKAPATLARVRASLATLIRLARAANATKLSADDLPRLSRKVVNYRDTSGVPLSRLKKMVSLAETPRDKAVLLLMGALGLRRQEVVSCRVRDFQLRLDGSGAADLFVMGKGRGGQREAVTVPIEVAELIEEHLRERGEVQADDPLFRGRHTRGLSATGLAYVVKAHAAKAGITKKVSPHRLRHSAATIALDTCTLAEVQVLLRHRDPRTTQIYDDNRTRHQGKAAAGNVSRLLDLDGAEA